MDLLISVFWIFLLWTVTPIPAVLSFHVAWNPDHELPEFRPSRLLLLISTTICPVALLSLHAAVSTPEWKESGDVLFYYIAKGPAAWIYFPPFLAANFLIALAIVRTEISRASLLTHISLLTCLLICLLFTAGNTGKEWLWAFPFSAACGYAYGIWLLIRSRHIPQFVPRNLLIVTGWMASVGVTVLASMARAKEMMAELPETPPDCFIVTAAARGHRTLVGSTINEATGQLTNNQLNTFRSFERRLILQVPTIHRILRTVYNFMGRLFARLIVFRWQADIVYLLLKPLEVMVRRIR